MMQLLIKSTLTCICFMFSLSGMQQQQRQPPSEPKTAYECTLPPKSICTPITIEKQNKQTSYRIADLSATKKEAARIITITSGNLTLTINQQQTHGTYTLKYNNSNEPAVRIVQTAQGPLTYFTLYLQKRTKPWMSLIINTYKNFFVFHWLDSKGNRIGIHKALKRKAHTNWDMPFIRAFMLLSSCFHSLLPRQHSWVFQSSIAKHIPRRTKTQLAWRPGYDLPEVPLLFFSLIVANIYGSLDPSFITWTVAGCTGSVIDGKKMPVSGTYIEPGNTSYTFNLAHPTKQTSTLHYIQTGAQPSYAYSVTTKRYCATSKLKQTVYTQADTDSLHHSISNKDDVLQSCKRITHTALTNATHELDYYARIKRPDAYQLHIWERNDNASEKATLTHFMYYPVNKQVITAQVPDLLPIHQNVFEPSMFTGAGQPSLEKHMFSQDKKNNLTEEWGYYTINRIAKADPFYQLRYGWKKENNKTTYQWTTPNSQTKTETSQHWKDYIWQRIKLFFSSKTTNKPVFKGKGKRSKVASRPEEQELKDVTIKPNVDTVQQIQDPIDDDLTMGLSDMDTKFEENAEEFEDEQ